MRANILPYDDPPIIIRVRALSTFAHSFTILTQLAFLSESIRFSTTIAGTARANNIIMANITEISNRVESAWSIRGTYVIDIESVSMSERAKLIRVVYTPFTRYRPGVDLRAGGERLFQEPTHS